MIDEIIGSIVAEFGPLSLEAIDDIKRVGQIRKVNRGDILVREGEYSYELYYIAKGGARAYYLKDGKTITDWFAFENDFISSIVSFFLGVPSQHYIEILEDTTFMVLQLKDIEVLCDKYHDFERLARMSTTKTMLQLQQRIVSLQFKSSKERYDSLLERYPQIELRAPLGDIASYLGITQETLSRIRNPKNGI
ncbi:Crp/Fnr family transcriptional regulator [Maribacter algarum]|uniref:Crp/Fnr family transcriptional regulator n=1 Tax=Maribacter algarum (ex Zhang et al. 2020) TaxID=2578118 RepID=A0A5S3PTS8_9FLAO|nr:Crp/Fnr family transcriptional regulator [Maribacter algarum]TMM56100.1 Crp/Fnr family transcriptional regulator [Maribacter algarum]